MTLCNDSRGLDKLLHFLSGALIALAVGNMFALVPPHMPLLTLCVSVAAAALAGLIKELADKRKKGNHFCSWDWLYTTAGGFAVCWLPWLTAYLLATAH